jgi:hypothetical protein
VSQHTATVDTIAFDATAQHTMYEPHCVRVLCDDARV